MDRREKILEIATLFQEKFGADNGPGTGYLAGIFKVSKEAIRRDLEQLEKEGKIKRLKADVYHTDWVINK